MINPKIELTIAPMIITTRKGGFQPMCAKAECDIIADT